ncbi:MAG: DUF3426 domain-containing protein [Litorimonas sp.]
MSGFVIACPECGTRYRSDPKSFGKRVRHVQCAKCGATWNADAPDPVATLVRDPDALAHRDNAEAISSDALRPAALESIPDRPDTPLMRPTAETGVDVMMRDQADRKRLQRRLRTIRIIWAVPVVLVVLATLIAWFNRQAIVNRIPQMASVYRMAGIDIRAGGLDLDAPEARTVLVDGAPVLRVDGAVRNLTRREQPIPLIELSLHDVDGQGLLQWFVETQPGRIDPRGRLAFRTEIADPPDAAVSLRYRFSVGDDTT